MYKMWEAAGHSALNFEQLVFLLSLIVLRPSNRRRKLARLGAMIGLTALPLGLLSSVIFHSFDASDWGLVVVPIAGGYMIAGLVRLEGVSQDEQRALKERMHSKPKVLPLCISFIFGVFALTFVALTYLVTPAQHVPGTISSVILIVVIILGCMLYRVKRGRKSDNFK